MENKKLKKLLRRPQRTNGYLVTLYHPLALHVPFSWSMTRVKRNKKIDI